MNALAVDSGNGGSGYSISRAIHDLWATHGIPVSFITSLSPEVIAPLVSAHGLEAALDGLVQQASHYRWSSICGRYVVYPTESIWDSVVTNVVITGLPRIDAATSYVSLVQTLFPALADLQPPVILGDPRAPLYAELVSLSRTARLIEHLVELLGTNERLAFMIEPALSGALGLNFRTL